MNEIGQNSQLTETPGLAGSSFLIFIRENRCQFRAVPFRGCQDSDDLKTYLYLMQEGDALRKSAFQRRRLVEYGSPIGEVYSQSPKDLILDKLIYWGLSGQPKHARYIAAIPRGKEDQLDFGYMDGWVGQLGLESLWKEILADIA